MSTEDRAWTDDPSVLLRHQVLTQMGTGEKDCVEIAHSLTGDPEQVGRVFEHLISQGLAHGFPKRLSDTYQHDAGLTAEGHARVSAMHAARTPGAMKRGCTAAMLAWLDANDGVMITSTDDLQQDVRGHFYGEPFTTDLLRLAAHDLRTHGLIRGITSAFGPVGRPEIDPLGRAVHVKHGGDLGAWQADTGGGGTTITVTGSTGVTVANHSPAAEQTVHVTTDAREQVLNLAAALEQMTPALGLADVDLARAAGLVGQLREAAEVVDTDPGRSRRLLDTVKVIATEGAGSAAGTALVALVDAVAQNL